MKDISFKSSICILSFSGLMFLFTGLVFTASRLQSMQIIENEKTEKYLNGYKRSITGETLSYHSNNPNANTALLVRTISEKGFIEWETEPVPENIKEEYITFVWIAGVDVNENPKKFDLFINNNYYFSFYNPKDTLVKNFKMENKGVSLTFNADYVDKYDDLFGYVFLKVRKSDFKAGQPLTIKIVGENANQRNWYMIMKYSIRLKAELKPLNAILRGKDKNYQVIKAGVEYFNKSGELKIVIDGNEALKENIVLGYNEFLINIPEVNIEKKVNVIVEVDKKQIQNETLLIKPVKRIEMYFLPHSHNDIGYSDLQTDVEKKQLINLESALKLSKLTETYPVGSRFKWNVEILWAVESFMNSATDEKKKEFIQAVKEGRIGLQAYFSGQLTGLSNPEELLRITEYARKLSKKYGVNINSITLSDIPGFNWSVIPTLAQSGIKYFSSGPNYITGLPDGGDRVGHSNNAWGDKPFYWISPSGEEKVLFWMAGKGYSWFHAWNARKLNNAKGLILFDYLDELEKQNYLYDMVQVRYTIGGDNGPADADLADFVKNWNEKYISPNLIISTSDEMFTEFERRYAGVIPQVRGDFTPYWEDGALSSIRETSMNRNTAERLVQAGALYSMFSPNKYPVEKFYSAWRNELLFNEHTWGAHSSISEPDSPFAMEQWRIKQSFAIEADKTSKELVDTITNSFLNNKKKSIINVINTNSWPRTDLVLIPSELSNIGDRVKDEKNKLIPSQRLSTGELAILAENIPPIGFRKYLIEKGKSQYSGKMTIKENEIDNGIINLKVNKSSGALESIKILKTGHELVDNSKNLGINEYLYVPGRNPKDALQDKNIKLSIKENGPLVASIIVESNAPGTNKLVREIKLIDGVERIDISNVIDKKKIRDKEFVHFAFPFNVPGGIIKMDVGLGVIQPEIDQLKGSCKDYFSVQRWLDISNQDYGVTFASIDIPLIEIGKMTDESGINNGFRVWAKTVEPGQTIFSYVMNNYWHTNYKADQEGPANARYSILPHQKFDTAAAYRFGLERSEPLIVSSGDIIKGNQNVFLDIKPSGVIVLSLKPGDDGKSFIFNIYNVSGKTETVELKWNKKENVKFYLSNAFEDKIEEIKGFFEMRPQGYKIIRVEKY